MPKNTIQNIVIDARGQKVSASTLTNIRAAIMEKLTSGTSASSGGIGSGGTSGGGMPGGASINVRVYFIID